MSVVSARKYLKIDRSPVSNPVTGTGVSVLLLDCLAALKGPFSSSRFLNLAETHQGLSVETAESTHALRVASISSGDTTESGAWSGGIAPGSKVYFASHEALAPNRFRELVTQLNGEGACLNIVAVPWSVPEDSYLSSQGRVEFSSIYTVDKALIVAAAGHDGIGKLRFPATCEHVLSVGVYRENGEKLAYSGTSLYRRKPELVVLDRQYAAQTNDGTQSLNGTSAAVAIVTGVAALWFERLKRKLGKVSPTTVFAALMASSDPIQDCDSRICTVPSALVEGIAFEAFEFQKQDFVRLSCSGPGRLAVKACPITRSHRWCSRDPVIQVTTTSALGTVVNCEENSLWSVTEIGEEAQEVEISVKGGFSGLSVVFLGPSCTITDRSVHTFTQPTRTILGVSCSHNSSACIFRNETIERAIQLERLSRRKNDGTAFLYREDSIKYCLDSIGLTQKDVDFFAFNLQPVAPGWVGLSQPTHDDRFSCFDPFAANSFYISHHLSHALGAFFASGFEEAAVLVCDGSGGTVVGGNDLILNGPAFASYLKQHCRNLNSIHTVSIYHVRSDGYNLVHRETSPSFNVRCGASSIGETYAAVSNYIFGDWHASGKLMGLAPYGDPNSSETLLEVNKDNLRQFRNDWQNTYRYTGPKSPMEHRHLAARIQHDFTQCMLDRARKALEVTSSGNLVVTGGLALNCAANNFISEYSGASEVFFFPASNDAGISIGAAVATEFHVSGHVPRSSSYSDFLGHPYLDEDVDIACREYAGQLSIDAYNEVQLAKLLASGQVIGWFEGGAEFGPRSLGHRSILADPRKREMWQYINARIKFREDFRPLAPMVPEEVAEMYFEVKEASPFMMRAVPVRSEYRTRLGAICHVDGSARVQTVSRAEIPRIHSLLNCFGAISGIPILLNTSLNRQSEPVIETPLEAIELLLSSGLDGIVINNRFVRRALFAGSSLNKSSVLALAPGVVVNVRIASRDSSCKLLVQHGVSRELPLSLWFARILQDFNGKATVGEVVAKHLPPDASEQHVIANLIGLESQKILLRVA